MFRFPDAFVFRALNPPPLTPSVYHGPQEFDQQTILSFDPAQDYYWQKSNKLRREN